MEAPLKYFCLITFVVALSLSISFNGVQAGGECGRASPETEAFKLAPCASASQREDAMVTPRCCSQVKKLGQRPSCLCAVMLSNTAKSAGVLPEVAITIPKRCNIPDRPVGYDCGGYVLP